MALIFTNPIVGGTTLVRAAIQSPDYVAGSSGWSINQDGTVEFSTGTFRGRVHVGTATNYVDIDPANPTQITIKQTGVGAVDFSLGANPGGGYGAGGWSLGSSIAQLIATGPGDIFPNKGSFLASTAPLQTPRLYGDPVSGILNIGANGDGVFTYRNVTNVEAMGELRSLLSMTNYTPQVVQGGGAIGISVNRARYCRLGPLCVVLFDITMVGSGIAGNTAVVTLPIAPKFSSPSGAYGAASIYDSSAATRYGAVCEFHTFNGGSVSFVGDWAGGGNWGLSPAIGLANGDVLRGVVVYDVV